MFDRILLAIDDSPSSEIATAFATAIARRSGASVHVFFVNEYLVSGGGVTLQTRDEAARLVNTAIEQLREAGVAAGGSARVAHYRKVAQCIVAAAEEHEVDAVVLGSRRQRRLQRVFSFQVRERVTRLTSLPVLTAPSPLTVPRRPELSLDDLLHAELERTLSIPI
jgi:nucleotide-binding universal stress UspA family protein